MVGVVAENALNLFLVPSYTPGGRLLVAENSCEGGLGEHMFAMRKELGVEKMGKRIG